MSDSTKDNDDKPLVEQALDVFVYAPLGLALEAREQLPQLAERGRGQVAMARVMGRFAAAKGQAEAGKIVSAAVEGFNSGVASTPAASTGAAEHSIDDAAASAVSAVELPIDGYDTLSAANIVKLLSSLEKPQLKAIADYEAANRSRVTVLNRVRQLLEAS